MELRNFRPLIILGGVLIVLLVVYLIITASNNSGTSNKPTSNKKEKNIVYPELKDSAEEVLAKIYNSNYDYYTGFTNKSDEKDNIFGNEKELYSKSLDQTSRMAYALYTFNTQDMTKISCNVISWNSSWNSKCGTNGSNMAYSISVSDLNNRIEEIFNIRPDYSLLDIDNLEIGSCAGENRNQYKFRYIKDRSIFVSEKRDGKCFNSGKIEITSVNKTQHNNLLTLDIFYNKVPTTEINNRSYYGNSTSYQDKFFFKVKKDGTYYFNSSTLFKEIK